MASETSYRGLTIRIGGDVTKLTKALTTANRAITATQGQLRRLNQATRLDPGSANEMTSRLDLVRRKALEVASRMAVLSDAVREVGRSEGGGGTIAQLADKTEDAALDASRARDRYNELNEELAKFYNVARKVTGIDLHADEHMGNVDSWNAAMKGLQGAIDAGSLGDDAAEVQRLVEKAKEFRSVWEGVSANLKERNTVARFVDLQSELQRAEAEARALGREMADLRLDGSASKEVKALDRELSELGSTSNVAAGYLKRLDDALRLDPGNANLVTKKLGVLESQSKVTKDQISALEAKMRALGDDAHALADSKGIVELARDAKSAREGFEGASARVQVLKGRLEAARSETEQMRQAGRDSGEGFERAQGKVKRLETDLREAEEDAEGLYREAKRLADAHTFAETSQEVAVLNANLKETEQTQRELNNIGKFNADDYLEIANRLSNVITPALRRLGSYALDQAETVDSAFRDMAKTVDATDEELEALRLHAQEFSTTHFTSADQMLEIMAMGGQLGIAADNLEAFADVASSLEIATNMGSASEIAQTLGQMAAIMDDLQDGAGQLDTSKLESYADAITRLGNNMPALESDISNISQRLASQANILGMTTPEVLAWSTALAATGQKSEAAGTALAKTFTMIELAVGSATGDLQQYADQVNMGVDEFLAALQEAPEQFSELAEEMGVETDELASSIVDAGAKLESFADIAGMTADQFAAMWANDPSSALQAFVEGLAKIDDEGGSVDAVLQSLGITSVRQKQAIEGLTQTVDILGDALTMSQDAWDGVSDQWGAAGDAAREAERKAQGFSGTLQEMRNTAQVFASEIGTSLLPYLHVARDALKDLYDWYSGLSENQQTSATMFGGLIASLPLAASAIGKFKKEAKDLESWQGKLAAGAGKLVDKLGATNVAAGGLAAVGLALVVTTSLEAYRNLTRLDKASKSLSSSIGRITSPLDAVSDALEGTSDSAHDAAASYLEFLGSFEGHVQAIEGIADSFEGQWNTLTLAEQYLREYAGQSGLAADEQGKLAWAVDQVNDLCGAEWELVDAANGAIHDQEGAVVDATAAIEEYIEAKKREIRLNAYEETLTELYQQRQEVLAQLEEQQQHLAQMQSLDWASLDGGGDAASYAVQEQIVADLTQSYDQLNEEISQFETLLGETASQDLSEFSQLSEWARNTAVALGDVDQVTLSNLASELDGVGAHFRDLQSLSTDEVRELVERWQSGEEDLRAILADLGVLYEDAGMGITRSMGKAGEDAAKAYTSKIAQLPGSVANETRKVRDRLQEGMDQSRNAGTWASNTSSAYVRGLQMGGVSGAVSSVRATLSRMDMSGSSYDWGSHLIGNLASGIRQRMGDLDLVSKSAASTISKYLRHSTPDYGPLSDDDVWGAHLIDNIIDGMGSRDRALERASLASAELIADSMDVSSRLSVPTMADAPVTSLKGVVQGGNVVYIDGARINDTPAIRDVTKDYLIELSRKGAM